jgi:hypothetical protein
MLAVAVVFSVRAGAQVKYEEVTLLPDAIAASITISPRGQHVAGVIAKGSGAVVIYDGVEGPRFEEILTIAEQRFSGTGGQWQPPPSGHANAMGVLQPGLGAGGLRRVLFSDDGNHYAYVGRNGADYAIMLDGKEVHRGQYTHVSWLAFNGGRLVTQAENQQGAAQRIIVGGEAGPFGTIGPVFTTPDAAHYAYNGQNIDAQAAKWAVVDGKQVQYFGDILGFMPNGSLLSQATANGNTVILANGKPISQVSSLNHFAISPVGARLVMLVTPPLGTPPQGKPRVLTIDGQIIPGTEDVNVMGTWFSPDGKRYAVLCQRFTNVAETFMVVDGKKELNYQQILNTAPFAPSFSPDSSRFMYIAQARNGQTFVVVNGEESTGVQTVQTGPFWSSTGSKLAWGGTTPTQQQVLFVDGKAVPLTTNSQPGASFAFSPDGSRFAWTAGIGGNTLVVDAAPVPGVSATPFVGAEFLEGTSSFVRFSPDSKHFVHGGTVDGNLARKGVWVNGKLITQTDLPQYNRVRFTPDSQHVTWAMIGAKNGAQAYRIFVDGREAFAYSQSVLDNMPHAMEMGADGTLTLLGIDGGALKRYRIPPPADTSVTSMLAAVR